MEYAHIWAIYALQHKQVSPSNDTVDEDGDKCKQCNGVQQVYYDEGNGMRVCKACGVVQESCIVDQSMERNIGHVQHNAVDPLLPNSSTSTRIFSNNRRFMTRIHDQLSMNHVERSRYHVFQDIAKVAGEFGHLPPAVIEQAKFYYKIVSDRKLSRGMIRKGLIACCILHACVSMNAHRSINEISYITSVPTKTIIKTNKTFVQLMHDILHATSRCDNDSSTMVETIHSKHLVVRYCSRLELGNMDERRLIREVNRIHLILEHNSIIRCRTPSAIVVGVITYACSLLNIELTKTHIAKVLDVSLVTINKVVKTICDHFGKPF